MQANLRPVLPSSFVWAEFHSKESLIYSGEITTIRKWFAVHWIVVNLMQIFSSVYNFLVNFPQAHIYLPSDMVVLVGASYYFLYIDVHGYISTLEMYYYSLTEITLNKFSCLVRRKHVFAIKFQIAPICSTSSGSHNNISNGANVFRSLHSNLEAWRTTSFICCDFTLWQHSFSLWVTRLLPF